MFSTFYFQILSIEYQTSFRTPFLHFQENMQKIVGIIDTIKFSSLSAYHYFTKMRTSDNPVRKFCSFKRQNKI